MATKKIEKKIEDKSLNKILENSSERKSFLVTKNVTIVLVVLLFISFSTGAYFYKKSLDITQKDPQKELNIVIMAVGKLMVLPTDETPTMATVSDPEKLKDQAFFVNAKVGDKVLIYTKSKKAILYSPTQNKIVEVSPLNVNQ